MGDLIRIPHCELTSTLEPLDCLGVTQHDFARLRKASSWEQEMVARILKRDPLLWAMLGMEATAVKAGFSETVFRVLAHSEDKLMQMLALLRPSKSEPKPFHLIDCDATPFIPDGLFIEAKDQLANRVRGQFAFDLKKIRLHLSPNQRHDKCIEGNKLRMELAHELVLDANVLDYLLANPNLIPSEWKDKAVFFWGTIYRGMSDFLFVRYLHFSGDGWGSDYRCLGIDWDGGRYSPAAVVCETSK